MRPSWASRARVAAGPGAAGRASGTPTAGRATSSAAGPRTPPATRSRSSRRGTSAATRTTPSSGCRSASCSAQLESRLGSHGGVDQLQDGGGEQHPARDRHRWRAMAAGLLVDHQRALVDVGYDYLEGARFRHPPQFVRWRPDRDPASWGCAQLDQPSPFDVGQVLAGRLRADRSQAALVIGTARSYARPTRGKRTRGPFPCRPSRNRRSPAATASPSSRGSSPRRTSSRRRRARSSRSSGARTSGSSRCSRRSCAMP